MKNQVEDLRNHLFAQLERLGDEELKGDALKAEVQRSKAIADVAQQIVAAAEVELKFMTEIGKTTSVFFEQKQIGTPQPQRQLR